MKIQLLKDVALPQGGAREADGTPKTGAAGQIVTVDEATGKAYIKRKLAIEVQEKQDKPADVRTTKPAKGPTETK